MLLSFQPTHFCTEYLEKLAQQLQLPNEKAQVRTYAGIAHALAESVVGVAKLYPIKKKIYYFKNMNPLFEEAVLPLAREGYSLIPLDLQVLQEPSAWAQSLGREDLFVLYSVDESLLGRAFDVSAFESALVEKSIIKIRVSHAQHFFSGTIGSVDKNTISHFSTDNYQSLSVLGERCHFASLVSDKLPIPNNINVDWLRKPYPDNQKMIVEFESMQVSGSQPVFKAIGQATGLGSIKIQRVYDRAAIYWSDIDGHALIDRLAKKMGFSLKQPGHENRLETLSLSRWGGVRTMDFLKVCGLAPEVIRGTVLINPCLLEDTSKFSEAVSEVHASITKDQLG